MHAGSLQLSATGAPAIDPLWRDQLGLLLESTGEGVFGIDLAGHCMFINRAAARLLGWEAGQVLGRNMHELTHHSHADGTHYPDVACPIFNAFRQGLPCRIDTEVFWRRDGGSFPVEYSSHPILDGRDVRGAVVTFVDITDRKRARDALQQANAELAEAKSALEHRVAERTRELTLALERQRELAAYSDQVREEERTRIAREVHDELGSLLVALRMDVNWLDKRLSEQAAGDTGDAQALRERMRSKCRNMGRLIENAVGNVGRIITDLRPTILDHQGLWAALEWQAGEFVRSSELLLDWAPDLAGQALPELPDRAAMAVFRIFQEMLSNVGRHAQATRVGVRIGLDGGVLRLSVQDNGRGAAAETFEAPTAYGVLGMRERARPFGGRIEIAAAPGQGCAVTLCMPLP
ncbi:MAG TPA: PAS domain-containing sensor histidine kinase [Ramlibacter sp.]|jgi:PAS domain S-box-containing protein|uniref:sensor histidine kinase n=1 Tax=Ramlibacter sp. TaxID=1917967 RepID=UPI002D417960|nr:PAS domain-containing sensor histidine kinase [Ramlibacter sp.]HZY16967.1 PAS domain-containing sensor histidine kinase [Ramlibacter sp.]